MGSGYGTTLSVPSAKGPTHDEKVLALLSDGKHHTHHELYSLNVIAHSRVASLRGKGHNILAWREGDDYLYQLLPPLESASVYEGPDADSSGDGRETLTPPAFLLGTDGKDAVAAPIPGQLVLEVAA